MSEGQVQIGGVEYDYHDSYRTRPAANREARKLSKQGYEVKIVELQDWEASKDIFDVFPKRFDLWKRQEE